MIFQRIDNGARRTDARTNILPPLIDGFIRLSFKPNNECIDTGLIAGRQQSRWQIARPGDNTEPFNTKLFFQAAFLDG